MTSLIFDPAPLKFRLNRQIDSLLTASNYPSINSGEVRGLEILLPQYAEQTAIGKWTLTRN